MKMKKKVDLMKLYDDPKYYGTHLIAAGNEFYAVKTGEEASKILRDIRKRLPEVTPQIAYKPKQGFLVV